MAMIIKRALTPEEKALKDERYTLPKTLEMCRKLADVPYYSLDVAACELAHCADHWYGKQTNGLIQPWNGHVWCNPPYSNILPWVMKAWDAALYKFNTSEFANSVSMLLPATRTEQGWWQTLVEPYRDRPGSILRCHFLDGRVQFGSPESPTKAIGSPPFTACLLVWKRP